MQKKVIREKKHRLWPELYTGERIISYTGNVKNRAPLFKNIFAFKEIEKILLSVLEKEECDAFVYLFMPDHFHFILSGKHENSNIKKCIDSFNPIYAIEVIVFPQPHIVKRIREYSSFNHF